MKGVILAAGTGTRLSSMHNGQHSKVLLEVAGRPLIDYTLEAFADAGIRDIAIVVGYQADTVKNAVGDGAYRGLNIQYRFNPDFLYGNALSLHAARDFVADGPFILSMADHMVSASLIKRLLGFDGAYPALAVDYESSERNALEGTRVLVDEVGAITQIGKEISRYNGIDSGVFGLTPDIFNQFDGFARVRKDELQLSRILTSMIASGQPLMACDITGCFWHDVDTHEDLEVVSQTLAGEATWLA